MVIDENRAEEFRLLNLQFAAEYERAEAGRKHAAVYVQAREQARRIDAQA